MSGLFEGITGQDQVTSYFQHALDSDNATHAYLIAGGAAGEGLAIATRFAAGLIAGSDQEAFDQAMRGVHPDLHQYAAGGAEGYLVDQIRELTHDAELAPIRANTKVYIVQDAQKLHGAPANAFLKTLEEPPENVVCILLANNEAGVLETLRSRCEVLTLNSSVTALKENTQVFEMLFELARGCGNQALLAQAKTFVELAREQAALAGDDLDVEAYIEKYDEYLSQGAKKQIEQQGKRESTARERAALVEQCALIRAWLRDCMLAKEGATALLSYPDFAAQTRQVAQACSTANIIAALDAVRTTVSRISYNVTPQLAIDAMFLEIRGALCH